MGLSDCCVAGAEQGGMAGGEKRAAVSRPSPCWVIRMTAAALVLGYAALPECALEEAARLLAAALADAMQPQSSRTWVSASKSTGGPRPV